MVKDFLHVASCVVDWHGALILFLLSCGWLVATRNKDAEAVRLRSGLPCSHLNQQRQQAGGQGHHASARPSVFVIVPAKGVKQHSLRNWRTFIQSARSYQGRCEILFCVESSDDEAAKVVRGDALQQQELSKQQQQQQLVRVGVKVCGQARTCSQKLHNMVSGIDAVRRGGAAAQPPNASPTKEEEEEEEEEGERESGDWDYVLYLDDDVKLHERLVDNLVDTLEHNPKAFMCTAYPFDVPASESGKTNW